VALGVALKICVVFAALLGACKPGPSYVRPSAPVPASGWKTAEPRDTLLKGPWWELFGDAALNALESQVSVSNQSLVAAAAQLRQARALVGVARAAYFPTVGAGVSASRAGAPNGGATSGPMRPGAAAAGAFSGQFYSLHGDFSWEVDLFGRVGRQVEASRAGAQASAADLEATRLSLQAELAQDYFQAHALDAQRELLNATVVAYEKSLKLTRDRYASGVASRADVLLAETQLETTKAQSLDIGVQRVQLENAIAVLIGRPPPDFSLPTLPLTAAVPPIPVGVPSELLERRPDIAAAERRVAAANAQIGVASAAFFPNLTLSASTGMASSTVADWLSWPSAFWSLGASLLGTIFQGGQRRAQKEAAIAAHEASVALYRQTVLTAFQEVANNLEALRILGEEAAVQERAVKAARTSLAITLHQYKAGTASYLTVIVAQTTLLNNERTAVEILGRRMTATVLLIKALGGGWTTG
jgi:NodT family efflux transporter outer membrane factor (OMF) lipoprotein